MPQAARTRRKVPKKTDAFRVFEVNLDRSRAFLRMFDKDRGVGQPTNDEKELLRGSLVFAVGALDAYLSDLIMEIVPKYAPRSSQLSDALKAIAKSDPGLSLRVALAQSDADRWEEFGAALEDWLATKSFHGPAKVAAALEYVACPITWDDLDAVTEVSTAEELARVTDERHEIVHQGKKPYIRRHLAEEANNLIAAIAQHIDREVTKLY
jgi:hypothetical protein